MGVYTTIRASVRVDTNLVTLFERMYKFRTENPWLDFYYEAKKQEYLPYTVLQNIRDWADEPRSGSIPFSFSGLSSIEGWEDRSFFDSNSSTWSFTCSLNHSGEVVTTFIETVLVFIVNECYELLVCYDDSTEVTEYIVDITNRHVKVNKTFPLQSENE